MKSAQSPAPSPNSRSTLTQSGKPARLRGVPRRLVFMGSPQAAVPTLVGLAEGGFEITSVLTAPDKRRGRGSKLSATPVGEVAREMGLKVVHDVASAAIDQADLGVVVAYGQLLRMPVLRVLPCVNVHFSLLPRWRGAAPVERAILAGDDETGVCVIDVDRKLDTGAIYTSRTVPIGGLDAEALGGVLAHAGAELMVETLSAGLGKPVAQQGEATYAEKLTADDYLLRFNRAASLADRVIRIGGAWAMLSDADSPLARLRVWRAEVIAEPDLMGDVRAASPGALLGDVVRCGDGALRLITVQAEGRARTDVGAWLNGARLKGPSALGTPPSPEQTG